MTDLDKSSSIEARAHVHARTGEDLIVIQIPGEPVPFARAGAPGKRRVTPAKQANAMGVVAVFAQQAMGGRAPIEGAIEMQVRATYLVPASSSAKKKNAAKWKSSRAGA